MSKLPWNGPLFPVGKHLAARYAQALKLVCELECPLSEFFVDRIGWSPQLAARLGEDYLSREALRHGIILSTEQATAPLLRRRFSYETQLINKIYLEARPTLLHLIESEPVIVEIDSGQAFCRTIADVLAIKEVDATLNTPSQTLTKTSTLQNMAREFSEKARVLDDSYIEQMLALVKQVGDPRRRPLPPSFTLSVGSLWAEVGGAVYVLRPPQGTQRHTLVVTPRPDLVPKGLPLTPLELGLEIVDVLHDFGFLRYMTSETFLRKRLSELERDALLGAGEERPAGDEPTRRRQLARNQQAHAALPELYWELDALAKRVNAGAPLDARTLSYEARWALSAPARDTEVVGHLLARFTRYDYTVLAHHHRRIVQGEWSRYSEAKRRYLESEIPHLTQGFIDELKVES